MNRPTPKADRARFCLSDADVLELAGAAIKIEDHYGRPMDIEWAKDGPDGPLYIVQARPETAASQRKPTQIEEFVLDGKGDVKARGRAVGARIASGAVRRVADTRHLAEFKPGEVLVADTTTPDWEPVMKTAAAIVTNRGGRTCHAAIVARRLGIPAVVGAEHATTALADGERVTVSCAEGAVGKVYAGEVAFHREVSELEGLKKPRAEIMVNLGNPDSPSRPACCPATAWAWRAWSSWSTVHHQVHPMALLHPERIADERERAQVLALIAGSRDGAELLRNASPKA